MTRYVYQFSFWGHGHEELEILDIVAESKEEAWEKIVYAVMGRDFNTLRLDWVHDHEHALDCPTCGGRHIDEGEWAQRLHRTHQCQYCGHEWIPFSYYTVGV